MPISVLNIVGMRFRRIEVNVVVDALIMARQAGVAVSCRQMESAYLQGVDLEKLTLLRESGINRLSIGVQSFNDRELRILGRPYSAADAAASVATDASAATVASATGASASGAASSTATAASAAGARC